MEVGALYTCRCAHGRVILAQEEVFKRSASSFCSAAVMYIRRLLITRAVMLESGPRA